MFVYLTKNPTMFDNINSNCSHILSPLEWDTSISKLIVEASYLIAKKKKDYKKI
jgi:hypothetical protein